MTELNQIYKCNVCGNIVRIMHTGAGELICCKKPMVNLKENSTDAATEKHVPVIEKTSDGYLVKIGSDPHPMEEKHYIEWIELMLDDKTLVQHLKPGQKPEVHFCYCTTCSCGEPKSVSAREHCNIHGLWKGAMKKVPSAHMEFK